MGGKIAVPGAERAVRLLVRYAVQSQRQVADWLKVGTGSAVAPQLQQLNEWEKEGRKLRPTISGSNVCWKTGLPERPQIKAEKTEKEMMT